MTLSKIISGQTQRPCIDVIFKLADFFEVSLDYLIKGDATIEHTAVTSIGDGNRIIESGATYEPEAAEVEQPRQEVAELLGQLHAWPAMLDRLMQVKKVE